MLYRSVSVNGDLSIESIIHDRIKGISRERQVICIYICIYMYACMYVCIFSFLIFIYLTIVGDFADLSLKIRSN